MHMLSLMTLTNRLSFATTNLEIYNTRTCLRMTTNQQTATWKLWFGFVHSSDMDFYIIQTQMLYFIWTRYLYKQLVVKMCVSVLCLKNCRMMSIFYKV